MALLLSESDVQKLLPMERAIQCVEASLVAQHEGRGINRARRRILQPRSSLHYMAAALNEKNEKWLGLKIYTITRTAWRFVVLLFAAGTGELVSVIEADHLGRLRTGAASGVATKFLARTEATRAGVIGTGRQARTQLEAVARVRKLTAAKVFGRNAARRRRFCREMAERLDFEVEPAESAEAAVRFGDIIVTATSSAEPVLRGEWVRAGSHLNLIGANMPDRREADETTLARAAVIAVDSLEQAKKEAGDLIQALGNASGLGELRAADKIRRDWHEVTELCEIVAGARPGRTSEDAITLFKSCGIALWDVAVAGYVYRQALRKGMGKKVDLCRDTIPD